MKHGNGYHTYVDFEEIWGMSLRMADAVAPYLVLPCLFLKDKHALQIASADTCSRCTRTEGIKHKMYKHGMTAYQIINWQVSS